MVLDPTGKPISEVLCEDEGLCVAEIDLSQAVSLKRIHDVVGYYNRFDIFHLRVNTRREIPVEFEQEATDSLRPVADNYQHDLTVAPESE